MKRQEDKQRRNSIILGIVLGVLAVLAYVVIILAVYMLK